MQCKLEVLHSNYLTICTFGLDCNFIMAITNIVRDRERDRDRDRARARVRFRAPLEEEQEKAIVGKGDNQ